MTLREWIDAHGTIVHRGDAVEAGFTARGIRAAIDGVSVRRVRRYWLATPDAPPRLIAAALASGHLACISFARQRDWWIPPDADDRTHVSVAPSGAVPLDARLVTHWNSPIVPPRPRSLLESVEDALDHIAGCLPLEHATVLWESAVRVERLSPEALRQVRWSQPVAREIAQRVDGLSDSGLETIFVHRLRPWRIPIRQQVVIAGRPVDALIGERLVSQIDGFAHHSSAADRARDAEHDRELRLRGYTVFRFTYAQVLYDWPSVERAIARAIAAGLHRAR